MCAYVHIHKYMCITQVYVSIHTEFLHLCLDLHLCLEIPVHSSMFGSRLLVSFFTKQLFASEHEQFLLVVVKSHQFADIQSKKKGQVC